MTSDGRVLVLSERDVAALLAPCDAIACAEEAFRGVGNGDVEPGPVSHLSADAARGNAFLSMGAVVHSKHVAGVKWIDVFSSPAPGRGFSHGNVVVLSDADTGDVLAIVAATGITRLRTAGGHAVVQARLFSNPNPETLTVLGCGAQAQAGVAGFLALFPRMREVRVFNRSTGPIHRLAQQVGARARVVACNSVDEAVAGSTLVLVASGATSPLLRPHHVRPGMTIIAVEGFRDIDPAVAKHADKLYLGYSPLDSEIIASPGLNPGGEVRDSDVYGDVVGVLAGTVEGRKNAQELIVSAHMGMGAHDVLCAALAYRRARERSLGTWVALNDL